MPFNGLKADYYLCPPEDGTYPLKEYKGSSIEKSPSFGNLLPLLQLNAGSKENSGIIFTGKIQPKVTGEHTFYIIGDNGFRLWIDGSLLIDFWKNEWDKLQTSGPIYLEAGKKYDFRLEYFQAIGGAYLQVSWSAPGMEKEIIPEEAFFLDEGFEGPMVSSIITEKAVLRQGNCGGVLEIHGSNLNNSSVEFLKHNDEKFFPAIYGEIIEESSQRLLVKIPEKLPAGKIKVAVIRNNIANKQAIIFVEPVFGQEGPRPEYPRPDWQREKWLNLNGRWRFEFDPHEIGEKNQWYKGHDYSRNINVPFPWESALSGIHEPDYLGVAWYERDLELDNSWSGHRIILNFGAVDWKCKVWINGNYVGSHSGGYTPFEFDITEYITLSSKNRLTVMVEDNRYKEGGHVQLIGKQGYDAPVGYTHTSGIWQTVYLTAIPSDCCFKTIHATPDIDNSQVSFSIKILNKSQKTVQANIYYEFQGSLYDKPNGSNFSGSMKNIELQPGENNISLDTVIPDQKLWNFDSPNLYEGYFSLTDESGKILDKVNTYFGQRKISIEKYDGRWYEYIYINNKPVFLSGLLDQGFWPDGIYTAPSDEALKFDVKAMRDLGFNLIRKHIKVEDPRQLYWADKYGMFIWADMPWGPGFNTPEGRSAYEYTLEKMIERDFNHPCIIAIILFNETWGITHNESTHDWMAHLYHKVKALYPSYIVEDMSPCNWDHIQPTDLFTFHMYPHSYHDAKNFVDNIAENAVLGSTYMFRTDRPSFKNEGEPWLNSEFGGVASGDGDRDVSWCFKYQLDIQRLHERMNGFVYTEPFDVEYEKNGILNYDRTEKIFGYDELAYGGDMSIKYLTQQDYIGFYNLPLEKLSPGSVFTAVLGAMNWSGNNYHNLTLKWRLDGTDSYGRAVETGINGSLPIAFKPYTLEKLSFSFTIPNTPEYSKFVGTVTAWVEDSSGKILAKNFTNMVVSNGQPTARAIKLGEKSWALRQTVPGIAEKYAEITYALPEELNPEDLRDIKILVELSSHKPGESQTSPVEEAPSDITVSINGHEITTLLIPDNPRDIRGILSLDPNWSSACNYGYLVRLTVPENIVAALQDELKSSRKITVSYEIKDDAENKNGMRFYGETEGRYAVDPMLLINAENVI